MWPHGGGVDGQCVPECEPVRDALADVIREQEGRGAAVAAWHDGRWLVDLWGGTADAVGTERWQRDTTVMPYSVSKPFAALPLLMLIDAGRIDLDAPMRTVWPELVADATVRQVLAHSAGVVVLDEPAPTDAFYEWDDMCRRIAAQPPLWEPGSARGESALFYGHLVGEPVRRLTGQTPGTFLRHELPQRGIDFTFGLTARDQSRVAHLGGFDGYTSSAGAELHAHAVGNPPGAFDEAVVNSARWRAAEVPAINGHGTARAVAQLYVELVTGDLLSRDLVAEMSAPQSTGVDRVFGHDGAWGLGVAVDDEGFGMGGSGGHWAGWSTSGGYAIGFVTSVMGDHARGERVEAALRECLGLAPLD